MILSSKKNCPNLTAEPHVNNAKTMTMQRKVYSDRLQGSVLTLNLFKDMKEETEGIVIKYGNEIKMERTVKTLNKLGAPGWFIG